MSVPEVKSFPRLKDEGQGIMGGGENGFFCSEWGQGYLVTNPESSQLWEVSGGLSGCGYI